jgi:hypothetical protein
VNEPGTKPSAGLSIATGSDRPGRPTGAAGKK